MSWVGHPSVKMEIDALYPNASETEETTIRIEWTQEEPEGQDDCPGVEFECLNTARGNSLAKFVMSLDEARKLAEAINFVVGSYRP